MYCSQAKSDTGDRPIQGVARPADLDDAELRYWVKDEANPVVGSAGLAGYPSQIWKNGDHWNYIAGDLPCNIRREGGKSLVIVGSSLVILEGKACNPL